MAKFCALCLTKEEREERIVRPCRKALVKLGKAMRPDRYKLCIKYSICPKCGGDLIGAGFLRNYCDNCKINHDRTEEEYG